MKRIIIPVLSAAAVLLSVSGCNDKVKLNEPNGIYYGDYIFYLSKAFFYPAESGEHTIVMKYGSKEDFENPALSQAYYNELYLGFTGDVSGTWEGEYELSGMYNRFEYGGKYHNQQTGETESESYTVDIVSGTLTIKQGTGNNYKVAMEGISSDARAIKLLYDGPVSIEPVIPAP